MTDDEGTAAERIDRAIASLGDWRGELLGKLRATVLKADGGITEDVKWVKPTNPNGVPTWSKDGILVTGEVYKAYVKLTFAQGASLDDPKGLFNASLDAGTRRAIDIREGDDVDLRALTALVREAVGFNEAKAASKKR